MLLQAGSLSHSTCEPYIKIKNLDGVSYKHPCDLVVAIDKFMMSECPKSMTKTQLDYAIEFTKNNDSDVGRADLDALDVLFAEIVISGKECNEIQGVVCG